jgi:hypothetical protein
MSRHLEVAKEFDAFRRLRVSSLPQLASDLAGALVAEHDNPMQVVHDCSFTTTAQEAHGWATRCREMLDEQAGGFALGGYAFELNGFDVNPDRWFVSASGTSMPMPGDANEIEFWPYDEYTLPPSEGLTLRGCEGAQAAFADAVPLAGSGAAAPGLTRSVALATWLVACRFWLLMADAWSLVGGPPARPALARVDAWEPGAIVL